MLLLLPLPLLLLGRLYASCCEWLCLTNAAEQPMQPMMQLGIQNSLRGRIHYIGLGWWWWAGVVGCWFEG